MGGATPNYGGNVGSVMNQYLQNLPQLSQVTSGAQSAADLAAARSAAATQPIYNQATLDAYSRFAPQLSAIGSSIGRSSAMAGAQTNADILNGPGAALSKSATALEQQANPEFYSTRSLTSGKIADLMNSINLSGLSGSERAEVERSLGTSQTATGNLGLDNATNAVSNAMTFGSALQTKRDALASAINTATNFLPQSKASFDPVSLALTGNPNTTASASSATGQFNSTPSSSNQAWGMGNNVFGGLNQSNIVNQGLQFQGSRNNSPMGIMNDVSGQVGNVCCFIFLEVLNGKLPWWVRKCRDRYYNHCPEVARGYKRMAKVLVPLMRYVPLVRFMVNRWMVQPLMLYGGHTCRVNGYQGCREFKPYRNFWFSVWKHLGTIPSVSGS